MHDVLSRRIYNYIECSFTKFFHFAQDEDSSSDETEDEDPTSASQKRFAKSLAKHRLKKKKGKTIDGRALLEERRKVKAQGPTPPLQCISAPDFMYSQTSR